MNLNANWNLILATVAPDWVLWLIIGIVVAFLAVIIIILSVFLGKKQGVREEPGDVIIIRREEITEEITKEVYEDEAGVAAEVSGEKVKGTATEDAVAVEQTAVSEAKVVEPAE